MIIYDENIFSSNWIGVWVCVIIFTHYQYTSHYDWVKDLIAGFKFTTKTCSHNPLILIYFGNRVTANNFLTTEGHIDEFLDVISAMLLRFLSFHNKEWPWTFAFNKVKQMETNANIFRVTGHLCGEFTGHRWIHRTKASDADELWCFLWSAPE